MRRVKRCKTCSIYFVNVLLKDQTIIITYVATLRVISHNCYAVHTFKSVITMTEP